MAEIKVTDLAELTTIPDDAIIYIVSDGVSYRGTKANFIKSIQNNIKSEILIPCPVVPEIANFATVINNLATFEIAETEIPTFKAVSAGLNPVTYYLELLGTGKGLYGGGGITLTAANLKLTAFGATAEDVETLATTVVVDLGVTILTVHELLNLQNPALTIQDQNDGYTIFKITVDGKVKSYLWIGVAGTYGVASTQSTAADFQVLNDQPQLISNLYLEKETFSPRIVYGSGEFGTVAMDKKSNLTITGTITKVKNIAKNNTADYFIGQPLIVIDQTTSGNVELPHMDTSGGTGVIPYFHPELTSYFTNKDEAVIFVLDNIGGQKVYRRISTALKNKSITLEKLQDIPYGNFIGRILPGTGKPQLLDEMDVLQILGLDNIVVEPIVITINKTAVNGEVYHNVGNNTYTDDPSPVLGKGYWVLNISGSPVIGGNTYSPETYLLRYYDGTSWKTNVIKKGVDNVAYSANRTITPQDNGDTIFMDSGTLTVNPSTQVYKNGHTNAVMSSGIANTPLVLTAATDWTYVINGATAVASASLELVKGDTCTIIKKANLKIFHINGGVI